MAGAGREIGKRTDGKLSRETENCTDSHTRTRTAVTDTHDRGRAQVVERGLAPQIETRGIELLLALLFCTNTHGSARGRLDVSLQLRRRCTHAQGRQRQ